MPLRIHIEQEDFEPAFRALLAAQRDDAPDVAQTVADILSEVRTRGDAALMDFTHRFDRVEMTAATMRVGGDELAAAAAQCPADTLEALAFAARRIEDHHARLMPADLNYHDEAGLRLGQRWNAVDAAGLYVPGGTAAYPSSVLMSAIPAKVAGVARRVMVVPAPDGKLNPLVLAAAHLTGITEVYRVGGAQAVAALAYGTETIQAVDVIVGPGNAYVTEAKRQVYGAVGIDSIAGPSEILVVADAGNDPAWIAADLLSQAEHDTAAQSILMTDDAGFADAVEQAVAAQLANLPRRDIARQSWDRHGAILVLSNLDEAPALIDRVAPEHLELAVEDPKALAGRVRHAGAIFLGRFTPEVIGDYVAGTNHVLPTARSARFSSGLSAADFMKRTSIVECGPDGLAALGPSAMRLARAEGLDAHAQAVAIRLNRR